MLESLKNLPFSLDQIPAAAQKPLSPDAPKPIKMMAAKGALPIAPDILLIVWYQLSFDADPDVSGAVKETVAKVYRPVHVEHEEGDGGERDHGQLVRSA